MSKNNFPFRFKATLAAAAVAALMLFGVAAPAHAAKSVGGIDVAAYCKKNVKSGFPLVGSKAVNTTNTWYGWGCGTRYGVQWVNMNLACAQQHPGSVARHGAGMYSWRCYR